MTSSQGPTTAGTAPTGPVEPLIEESIETSAPPVKVWSLVADLPRMAAWSPQVAKTIVRGRPVQLGTRAINLNRRGLLVWPTRSKVVRFEPHREIALRIKENWTIWSFTLEPTESGGTRVVQRREAPQGISPVSRRATDAALGGVPAFQAELRAGMRQTLERLRADAEA
jgi:uncharacterized protein YndB with AHSA1/START domain